MTLSRLRTLLRHDSGSSLVEFALVAPLFLALTVGLINFCILVYFNSVLHWAVDDVARCKAVGVCNSASLVSARETADFGFASLNPSFTGPTLVSCGYQVTATATYQLNAVLYNQPIVLNATSCFPTQS